MPVLLLAKVRAHTHTTVVLQEESFTTILYYLTSLERRFVINFVVDRGPLGYNNTAIQDNSSKEGGSV